MKNPQPYHSWDKLAVFTGVALGDDLEENFRKVAASRGDLHGYLTAVQVVVTGNIAESAAAADLPKEYLWDLLDFTLEGNMHTWMVNMPGIVVFSNEVVEGITCLANDDDWPSADVSSTTDSTPFTMSWLIPMSPKLFQCQKPNKGDKDGCFPLAAMRDWGRIALHVNALTGNWALYSGTTLTVKILLHTYWTDEVILPNPWRLDHWVTTDAETQAPARYGAMDMFWCADNDMLDNAFTLPTSRVTLSLDDNRLYDDLTGAMLEFIANKTGRDDSFDDIVDVQICPLYLPQQQNSIFECPTGRLVKVIDANSGQSGGDTKYVIRRFLPLSDEQTAEYTSLLGVKFDPAVDKARLSIARAVPGRGVPSNPNKLAGANTRIAT